MPRHLAAGAIATLVLGAVLAAAPQKTKPKPAPKPPAPPPVLTTPMPIACPDALGQGVKSGRVFCEVPVSHDPAHGDLIVVPKHLGTAVVRFHLHNRQLVSASFWRLRGSLPGITRFSITTISRGFCGRLGFR